MKEILKRMLDDVNPEYDREEGGLFHDALAPAAMELDRGYQHTEYLFRMGNPITAEGEYLDLGVMARAGVTRKRATNAEGVIRLKGVPGTAIRKGTKVSSDTLLFSTIEEVILSEGWTRTKAISETPGSIGNVPAHSIKTIPITIPGLQEVDNEGPFIGGYNEESDEMLRERYLQKVREPATSGNKYHYKRWTLSVPGVGACRVFPLWAGNGTVKVVFTDANMGTAEETLVQKVKEYIESVRPIGATVTVVSATAKVINIAAKVYGDPGKLTDTFKKNIILYFARTAFRTGYVSYAQVGNLLIDLEMVEDYQELTLNGKKENVELTQEEIPQLGEVKFEVISNGV